MVYWSRRTGTKLVNLKEMAQEYFLPALCLQRALKHVCLGVGAVLLEKSDDPRPVVLNRGLNCHLVGISKTSCLSVHLFIHSTSIC